MTLLSVLCGVVPGAGPSIERNGAARSAVGSLSLPQLLVGRTDSMNLVLGSAHLPGSTGRGQMYPLPELAAREGTDRFMEIINAFRSDINLSDLYATSLHGRGACTPVFDHGPAHNRRAKRAHSVGKRLPVA